MQQLLDRLMDSGPHLDVVAGVADTVRCHGRRRQRLSRLLSHLSDQGAPGGHVLDALSCQQLRHNSSQVLVGHRCKGLPVGSHHKVEGRLLHSLATFGSDCLPILLQLVQLTQCELGQKL